MHCGDCGFDNPSGSRYCAGCGSRMPACTHCEALAVPGGRFCNQCGRALSLNAAARQSARAQLGADAQSAAEGEASVEQAAHQEAERRAVAERRHVTVLFADIVGSTALHESMDPEDMAEIVNGAMAIMNRVLLESGGHIGQLMGDGLLAFFGAPVSHEDDPLRALRAALAMQEGVKAFATELEAGGGPRISIRVGLNSGLVLAGQIGGERYSEYTTLGDTVNTAARIESAAPPGGVLISEATARLVRGAVELEPFGELSLKGKSDSVKAYLVSGPPPAIGETTRGLFGLGTPLIGRELELARLDAAHADAVKSGRLAWVSLVGRAGLGKSRMLEAWLGAVSGTDPAPSILRGRAMDQVGSAYALWRALLLERYGLDASDAANRLRGELAEAAASDLAQGARFDGERGARDLARLIFPDAVATEDPQGLAERAGSTLIRLLEAWSTEQPLIVALDDLQWADDASLNLLARTIRDLHASSMTILCATRPDLWNRRPHWAEGEAAHQRLDLAPLSALEVGRQVDAILSSEHRLPESLVAFIVERSEGNPFYVEELVDMLREQGIVGFEAGRWDVDESRLDRASIPSSLHGMLQARLDGLGAAERQALQCASVVGKVFWDGAVLQLGVAGMGPLDALRARGPILARERSSLAGQREFVFRQSLMRDAAYEGLLRSKRAELHALAADWLEEQAGAEHDELIGQLARHSELAGRDADAARHYLAAAERSRRAYANEDAIDLYGRALALWPEDDAPGRFELLKGRELVLDTLGRREEQARDLDTMTTLAADLSEACRAELHAAKAWLLLRTGEPVQAEREAASAIELAHDEPRLHAEASIRLGDAFRLQSRAKEALAHYERAADTFRTLEHHRGLAKALIGQASACDDLDDIDTAASAYREALRLFRELEDQVGEAATNTNLAVLSAKRGDLGRSAPHFEAALRLYCAAGDRHGEGKARRNLGYLAMQRGDHAEAEANLRRAIEIAEQTGNVEGKSGAEADLDELLARRAQA